MITKNVIYNTKPMLVDNLGKVSYVNLDVRPTTITDGDQTDARNGWIVGLQIEVENPATRDRALDAAIKAEFPNGEAEAALRKGIIDPLNTDFMRLNTFAEHIKQLWGNAHTTAKN